VLGLVEYQLNSRVSSETQHSAFELTFGTDDLKYFHLPDTLSPESISNEFLKTLNTTLATVRELTSQHQAELIAERQKTNPTPELHNQYQPGDFVLYDTLYDPCKFRVPKLNSRHRGPFEVIRQVKNDVEVRHLNLGSISLLPVDRLSLFSGTREEGIRLAMEDADQFNIVAITAWRGDPEVRTTMEFEILFEGEDTPTWRAWDRDLSDAEPFAEYCRRERPLYPLIFDLQQSYRDAKRAVNQAAIHEVTVGDLAYLNLRFFSTKVYDEELDLPDKFHVRYVVLLKYTRFTNKHHHRIQGDVAVFKTKLEFQHIHVIRWGQDLEFTSDMVIVDESFIRSHRQVLQLVLDKSIRARLDKLYA
jgi:hypothetical protein